MVASIWATRGTTLETRNTSDVALSSTLCRSYCRQWQGLGPVRLDSVCSVHLLNSCRVRLGYCTPHIGTSHGSRRSCCNFSARFCNWRWCQHCFHCVVLVLSPLPPLFSSTLHVAFRHIPYRALPHKTMHRNSRYGQHECVVTYWEWEWWWPWRWP